MIEVMHATPASLVTPANVLDKAIKSGDCLMLPKDWEVVEAQDPPLHQQNDHASKWTIRTPDGIVHMWGTPLGGD